MFKFYINNKIKFEGQLIKQKCLYCCKITFTNICSYHATHVHNLIIKKSKICSGLGLFAKGLKNDIVFSNGMMIMEYGGDYINKKTLLERYSKYTAPYAIQVGQQQKYMDCALKRCIASYANTSDAPNAHIEYCNDNKLYIVANQNIFSNQEILVDYGSEFNLNEPTYHETNW